MTFEPDIGLGTVILFQSGFFAKIENVNISDEKREAISITNMSSFDGDGGFEEYLASRIVEAGEVDVTIFFDQDKVPPIRQAAESITIKFPLPAGKTNPGQIACTGFMISHSIAVPVKEKMTQNVKIKFTGKRVYTASS